MLSGQEIDPADVNQLKAACELALQRMALYHEDATEASTLTKPSRGSKDWPCIYHQYAHITNLNNYNKHKPTVCNYMLFAHPMGKK